MGKEKVSELTRKKVELEKDLREMQALKEKAFVFFERDVYGISLAEIKESYEKGAWHELIKWNENSKMHSGDFHFKDVRTVKSAFWQVNVAVISRKEFQDMLSGCRDDVERYIKELTDELQKMEQQLESAYDAFAQNKTGDYKWIFEQPFIKKLVLKFMSSETD